VSQITLFYVVWISFILDLMMLAGSPLPDCG